MKNEMENNSDEGVKKVAEMIKGIKFAMLTTADPDGELRSRPMTLQEADFNGELWFFNAKNSGKNDSILHDQHVNLSFANPDETRYVSLTGIAQIVDDKAKAKELWNPALKAWFPEGLEDPNLSLLKVEVRSAEYWDTPSGKMVTLIGFAKAILTGERAKGGENKKVEIRH